MKNLLVVLLVLSLTSLAGAATVKLTDENNAVVAVPGDTVRLTIEVDPAGLVSLDAIITVTGGDVISQAINTSDCTAYGWDPTLSFDPLGIGTSSVEIGLGNFMGNMNSVIAYVDVAYTGGVQYVSIAAGMGFGGSGILDLTPPAFSTGIVGPIPEPMTIALLGLGGLFLLRRRK